MTRPLRVNRGGYIYHVLNRGNGRRPIFEDKASYIVFEALMAKALERTSTRLLAFCLMPNHWHMVLWPREDGALSECMRWLTVTHTNRWHAQHGTAGTGHLYQGRFKSFPIQDNHYLLNVCRYVERNALRAGLADRAEAWQGGSAYHFAKGDPQGLLHPWPLLRPDHWLTLLNDPFPDEHEVLPNCVNRGRPYGDDAWTQQTIEAFGLESTIRPGGRPPKEKGS